MLSVGEVIGTVAFVVFLVAIARDLGVGKKGRGSTARTSVVSPARRRLDAIATAMTDHDLGADVALLALTVIG